MRCRRGWRRTEAKSRRTGKGGLRVAFFLSARRPRLALSLSAATAGIHSCLVFLLLHDRPVRQDVHAGFLAVRGLGFELVLHRARAAHDLGLGWSGAQFLLCRVAGSLWHFGELDRLLVGLFLLAAGGLPLLFVPDLGAAEVPVSGIGRARGCTRRRIRTGERGGTDCNR